MSDSDLFFSMRGVDIQPDFWKNDKKERKRLISSEIRRFGIYCAA